MQHSRAMSEQRAKAALAMQRQLRDDPEQERWILAAFEESPVTLEGGPRPVCHIQGPSTSSQGIDVVPLADLPGCLLSVMSWRGSSLRHLDMSRSRTATGGRIIGSS